MKQAKKCVMSIALATVPCESFLRLTTEFAIKTLLNEIMKNDITTRWLSSAYIQTFAIAQYHTTLQYDEPRTINTILINIVII